jgi:SpoIID/LytB domain protein
MYSSTAGARTRESEDIFPGLDVPYLSAVDSPNEPSPFVNWRFSVSSAEMTALLAQAGLLHGPLWSAQVETTPDGGGPWQVVIRSGTEVERVGSYRFRSLINSAAAQLMPDRLPARRPDGRRYPQTVLSGTYSIRAISQVNVRSGYRELTRRFVFEGQGWGHQVGMSQYGALAMAEAGETYDQILSHYYSGLLPEPAGPWLPASITVGLVVGTNEAVILAAEGASVLVDGEEVGPAGIGVWRFSSSGGDLVTQVPAGLGQAPTVRASRIRYDIGGYTVRFEVTAPAFLDVTVSQNARRVGERAIGLVEAGEFSYNLADLVDQELDRSQPVRVVVATTSPLGGTATSLNLVFER